MHRISEKKPKLLAVDLDGTLLDARGIPHGVDVRAMRTLASRGVRISIITGRLYSGTRPSAELLGMVGPVACVDGSQVVDASCHRTLVHYGICGDDAHKLRASVTSSGPAVFIFARDEIVHDASGEPYLHYVTNWSNQVTVAESVQSHPLWDHEEGITAVVAVGNSEQIAYAADEIERQLPGTAQVATFPIRRHPGDWGLVARAAVGSKGGALAWIADHYGIDVEETVVVGDWLNDLSMFAVAGRAFAMGQAPPEVKEAATDVLAETSDDGGGIARVVREAFGLSVG